jgi:hypothetical protein
MLVQKVCLYFYHISKVSLIRHSNVTKYVTMKISTADTTKFVHYDRDELLCQKMISLKLVIKLLILWRFVVHYMIKIKLPRVRSSSCGLHSLIFSGLSGPSTCGLRLSGWRKSTCAIHVTRISHSGRFIIGLDGWVWSLIFKAFQFQKSGSFNFLTYFGYHIYLVPNFMNMLFLTLSVLKTYCVCYHFFGPHNVTAWI